MSFDLDLGFDIASLILDGAAAVATATGDAPLRAVAVAAGGIVDNMRQQRPSGTRGQHKRELFGQLSSLRPVTRPVTERVIQLSQLHGSPNARRMSSQDDDMETYRRRMDEDLSVRRPLRMNHEAHHASHVGSNSARISTLDEVESSRRRIDEEDVRTNASSGRKDKLRRLSAKLGRQIKFHDDVLGESEVYGTGHESAKAVKIHRRSSEYARGTGISVEFHDSTTGEYSTYFFATSHDDIDFNTLEIIESLVGANSTNW